MHGHFGEGQRIPDFQSAYSFTYARRYENKPQTSRFNTFRELLQLRCRTSTEGNKSKKKQIYRTMSEATQKTRSSSSCVDYS